MKRIYLITIILTTAWQCSPSLEDNLSSLTLSLASEEQTKSYQEPLPISNANIYIFDSNGFLEKYLYLNLSSKTTLMLSTGNKYIATVVNMGHLGSQNINHKDDLSSLFTSSTTGNNGYLIATGYCEIDMNQSANYVTLMVKRVASKFTFTFDKSRLDPAVAIEIESIVIKNTPLNASLFIPNRAESVSPYGLQLYSSNLEPHSHSAATPLYVLENMQGDIGENQIPLNKHPGAQESLCTYIEITANYNSPSHSGKVKFRSFPGKNNINNYDVERGVHYMETLSFCGISISEHSWRTELSLLNRKEYNITAYCTPSSGGSVEAQGYYLYGEMPQLVATPADGFKFIGWNPPLEVVCSDFVYEALFEKEEEEEEEPSPTTVAVTGVEIDPNSIMAISGQSYDLVATLSPSNASNKELYWSSHNPAIASVDNNGKVTANMRGTTQVEVTTQDGNFKAYSTINVHERVEIELLTIDINDYLASDSDIILFSRLFCYISVKQEAPSEMSVIDAIKDVVSVNVNYSYLLNNHLEQGSITLTLDTVNNNDVPTVHCNGVIIMQIHGPISLQDQRSILETLTLEIEKGSLYYQNWYIEW